MSVREEECERAIKTWNKCRLESQTDISKSINEKKKKKINVTKRDSFDQNAIVCVFTYADENVYFYHSR